MAELAGECMTRDDCPKSPDGDHDFQMVQSPWPEGERLACRFCGRNTDGPTTGYCRACDYNRHVCSGCGDSIEHGENVCGKCKELLNA